MKTFLFTALAIIMWLSVFSQEYSEIVEIEGKTAGQLYNSAHEWMAIVFNSANDVIQLADPENKKLIAKGTKTIEHVVNGISAPITMYFTLVAEFKEARYRYQVYSTKFTSRDGTEYDYETLKETATEEGLLNYYKKVGVKPWIIGKKVIAENLKYNKQLLENANNALQDIPESLKTALSKKENDNW